MFQQIKVALFLALGIALSHTAWSNSYHAAMNKFSKSPQVRSFFNNSYGYAIFPTVGKGGIGLGGAHGKGRVYRNGVAVGSATLNQLTVGFQFGGQAFSQIIFFEDKRAFKEFVSGGFEFGAQATAVAITVGAQAQAGTTGASTGASIETDNPGVQAATYYKGMATFVHVKGGLMYEASVGGQKFIFKPFRKGKKELKPHTVQAPVSRPARERRSPATTTDTGAATYAVEPIEPVTELD